MILKCRNCKKQTTNIHGYCDDCKYLPRECPVCKKKFHPKSHKMGKIYCSPSCSSIINCREYRINDNFFTEGENRRIVYEMLGLIFACGYSPKRHSNSLIITSSGKNLSRLNHALRSDYHIEETVGYKKTGQCFLQIFSRIIVEYLKNIGLSSNKNRHDFPTIPNEHKVDFIRGFINTECGSITEYPEFDLCSITLSNRKMLQSIHEYTGGEIIMSNLKYNLIFQDKQRKYRYKR
jgi:hypothetical protein